MADFMATGFRLMTANLLHTRCDTEAFSRLLEKVNPDVVVIQELGPEAARVLADHYPNHHLNPATDFTGRGIATRLPVEFEDIEIPGRPGTAGQILIGDALVSIAGIHLLNPIDFPWWVSVRTRSKQLESLFQWLDQQQGPVVVAGDCNASPAWPAYKKLGRRLTDLVSDEAKRGERVPERTWGWRPGWPRMLRIDHVFGSGTRADHVEVAPIIGSDHHAVIADVRVLPHKQS